MQQWNQDLVTALTELAAAKNPIEVEARRRSIERWLSDEHPEVGPLIQAVAERALRCCDLERLATEDSLTGLANRRSFTMAIGRELARRRRGFGPCVILLDLDCLKEINDRFGHSVGDSVLVGTAELLRERLRRADRVYRIGGEEFVLLLGGASAAEARAIAERIRVGVDGRTTALDGAPLHVTVSQGVVADGAARTTCADLLVRADAMLYEAKHAGRDRIAWEDPDAEDAANVIPFPATSGPQRR